MRVLPEGVNSDKKYYVGYFNQQQLIALMDLIDGYPQKDKVFIGFFMSDVKIQNCGISSLLISELARYLQSLGYQAIQLAWVKGNPQAEHFWLKNGFVPLKETVGNLPMTVILAERSLIKEKGEDN
ncbi:MAG: GNAT family N-acetyltransferase [Erysipelotrichaceae bacterium]